MDLMRRYYGQIHNLYCVAYYFFPTLFWTPRSFVQAGLKQLDTKRVRGIIKITTLVEAGHVAVMHTGWSIVSWKTSSLVGIVIQQKMARSQVSCRIQHIHGRGWSLESNVSSVTLDIKTFKWWTNVFHYHRFTEQNVGTNSSTIIREANVSANGETSSNIDTLTADRFLNKQPSVYGLWTSREGATFCHWTEREATRTRRGTSVWPV